MDAVQFAKEYKRMCDSFNGDCSLCIIKKIICGVQDIEKVVEIVEQWSKENPPKTIMQDFFEKHPSAPKNKNGTPVKICPWMCGYNRSKRNAM